MPRSSRSPHSHGRSEVKSRPAIMREAARERQRLAARLRALRERAGLTQEQAAERTGVHAKHLQRLERGAANATLTTLVACAIAYGAPLRALFGEDAAGERASGGDLDTRPSRKALPLYSLRAAAGRFGEFQDVRPEGWVHPRRSSAAGKGLFVAQVVGESMNRRIPSGTYCVFRAPPRYPLEGKIVLAQHRAVHDPEQGGHYTVKVYEQRGSTVRLKPASTSPRYRPIVIAGARRDDLLVIAELVEVLREDPRS